MLDDISELQAENIELKSLVEQLQRSLEEKEAALNDLREGMARSERVLQLEVRKRENMERYLDSMRVEAMKSINVLTEKKRAQRALAGKSVENAPVARSPLKSRKSMPEALCDPTLPLETSLNTSEPSSEHATNSATAEMKSGGATNLFALVRLQKIVREWLLRRNVAAAAARAHRPAVLREHNLQRKWEVFQEILSTERDFVSRLALFDHEAITPMLAAGSSRPKTLAESDLQRLVAMKTTLVEAHRGLLVALEILRTRVHFEDGRIVINGTAEENSLAEFVSGMVSPISSHLKTTMAYANDFCGLLECMGRCTVHKWFMGFINVQKMSPTGSISLSEFLLGTLQRATTYRLIVHDLVAGTELPPAILDAARNVESTVETYIVPRWQDGYDLLELLDIQQQFKSIAENIVVPGRRILRYAQVLRIRKKDRKNLEKLEKQQKKNPTQEENLRTLLLFSDVLISCKGGAGSLSMQFSSPLRETELSVPEEPLQICLKFGQDDKKYFQFRSSPEMQEFICAYEASTPSKTTKETATPKRKKWGVKRFLGKRSSVPREDDASKTVAQPKLFYRRTPVAVDRLCEYIQEKLAAGEEVLLNRGTNEVEEEARRRCLESLDASPLIVRSIEGMSGSVAYLALVDILLNAEQPLLDPDDMFQIHARFETSGSAIGDVSRTAEEIAESNSPADWATICAVLRVLRGALEKTLATSAGMLASVLCQDTRVPTQRAVIGLVRNAEDVAKCAKQLPSPAETWMMRGEVQEFNAAASMGTHDGLVGGRVTLTNYQLRFTATDAGTAVEVPLAVIRSFTHTEMDGSDECQIFTKDFRQFLFAFGKMEHAIHPFMECVSKYVNAYSQVNLFAFVNATYRRTDIDPTLCYDTRRDMKRLGVPNKLWQISAINADYKLCSTYPPDLVLPTVMSSEELFRVAGHRSRGRIPALCYVLPNGTALCRSSQPLTGLRMKTSPDDEKLLATIQGASSSKQLVIVDMRPRINAIANQAAGKGSESVSGLVGIDIVYMNVDNIHVMRESLLRMVELCSSEDSNGRDYLDLLNSTGWLTHTSRILAASESVANTLTSKGTSVLVHCSDGWDRTAQVTALAQLLLDPFYRTIRGFQWLVEKEWTRFGHKFAERVGQGESRYSKSERSPVFLQFLDCVHQCTQQHPSAFEFNSAFLLALFDEAIRCRFGTFLCNSEREREALGVSHNTIPVWVYLNKPPLATSFKNHSYQRIDGRIRISSFVRSLSVWNALFFRYHEE